MKGGETIKPPSIERHRKEVGWRKALLRVHWFTQLNFCCFCVTSHEWYLFANTVFGAPFSVKLTLCFQVFLPTGTVVIVTGGDSGIVHLEIRPSALDFGKTEGHYAWFLFVSSAFSFLCVYVCWGVVSVPVCIDMCVCRCTYMRFLCEWEGMQIYMHTYTERKKKMKHLWLNRKKFLTNFSRTTFC